MKEDYSDLDVDKIVEEVYKAVDEGRTRPATKQESMKVRLAALAAIVRKMQEIVEQDHQMAVKERQMINA
jgi:hypothetical protein